MALGFLLKKKLDNGIKRHYIFKPIIDWSVDQSQLWPTGVPSGPSRPLSPGAPAGPISPGLPEGPTGPTGP